MTDLVLAAASNLGPPVFERYLKSLRDTGYQDDIVFFVFEPDLTPEVHQILSKYQCHALTFGEPPFVIHTYRFLMFESFLKEHQKNYQDGKVLVADSRDVIFQKNPFEFSLPEGCELCLAQETKNIAQDVYNSRWIVTYFGDAIYEQIRDNPILCSGTTLGTCQSMLYYFDRLNFASTLLTEQRLPHAVYEQGVHNYLYYTGRLEEAKPKPLPNSSGLFLTMGLDKKIVTEDGWITNREGVVSAIAHQVDRLSVEQLELVREVRGVPVGDLIEGK